MSFAASPHPFAAYLHLSHTTGEKSARTVASPDGLLIVDYATFDWPLGVEITAPQAIPLDRLNQLLADLASRPSKSRTTGPPGPNRRALRPIAGLANGRQG